MSKEAKFHDQISVHNNARLKIHSAWLFQFTVYFYISLTSSSLLAYISHNTCEDGGLRGRNHKLQLYNLRQKGSKCCYRCSHNSCSNGPTNIDRICEESFQCLPNCFPRPRLFFLYLSTFTLVGFRFLLSSVDSCNWNNYSNFKFLWNRPLLEEFRFSGVCFVINT